MVLLNRMEWHQQKQQDQQNDLAEVIWSKLFFGLSGTIGKCSRLSGAPDTWPETVQYRPLLRTRLPRREEA